MLARLRHPLNVYLLLCVIAALWIDFSHIHLGQTSDSLIPVLVSLQHWTPFYWEQSRFGMLVPLVAMPFDHPLTNLLVQNGITIFAGLFAIGLLARFFIRSAAWLPIACASCAVFVACLAEPLRCDYFLAQPYGLSFCLGLGALLVVESKHGARQWMLACGLMILASWVSFAVGPALLALVVARRTQGAMPTALRGHANDTMPTQSRGHGTRDSRLRFLKTFKRQAGPPYAATARLLGLTALGIIAGLVLETLAPYRDPQVTRLAPWKHWPGTMSTLVTNLMHQAGPSYRIALTLLIAGGGVLFAVRPRTRRLVLAMCLTVGLAALALILLAGASRWTRMNGAMPRYIYPAMLVVQTGLIAAIVLALRKRLGTHGPRLLPEIAAVAMLAAVGITYGVPSPQTMRACLDQRLGASTDKILQTRATHIAGDYWRVWPAVFHANLCLRDRGAGQTVWGIAFRSLPTTNYWRPRPGARCHVAELGHDPAADRLLQEFFPSSSVEQVSNVLLYPRAR